MSALFCVWARTGGLILSTVLPSLAPRPPGRQGPWRRQYRTEASVHVWAPFILSSCSQGWTVMDCEQMALPCFFRPWNRMASVMLFEWWGLKLIQRLQIHLYNVDFGINYAELKKTRWKIPTHTWDNLRHFQNHQSRRFLLLQTQTNTQIPKTSTGTGGESQASLLWACTLGPTQPLCLVQCGSASPAVSLRWSVWLHLSIWRGSSWRCRSSMYLSCHGRI